MSLDDKELQIQCIKKTLTTHKNQFCCVDTFSKTNAMLYVLQTFVADSISGITSTTSIESFWSFNSCCHPYFCPLFFSLSFCLSLTNFRMSSCISSGACRPYKQNAIIQPQNILCFLPVFVIALQHVLWLYYHQLQPHSPHHYLLFPLFKHQH